MKTAVSFIIAGLVLAGSVLAGDHPEHPKAKATAAGAGILDGMVFVGELGKVGDKKGDKDEFAFKKGTFVSTACVSYGFKAVAYQAKQKGGAASFTAKPKNEKSETMSWKGVVKKGAIAGIIGYNSGL